MSPTRMPGPLSETRIPACDAANTPLTSPRNFPHGKNAFAAVVGRLHATAPSSMTRHAFEIAVASRPGIEMRQQCPASENARQSRDERQRSGQRGSSTGYGASSTSRRAYPCARMLTTWARAPIALSFSSVARRTTRVPCAHQREHDLQFGRCERDALLAAACEALFWKDAEVLVFGCQRRSGSMIHA